MSNPNALLTSWFKGFFSLDLDEQFKRSIPFKHISMQSEDMGHDESNTQLREGTVKAAVIAFCKYLLCHCVRGLDLASLDVEPVDYEKLLAEAAQVPSREPFEEFSISHCIKMWKQFRLEQKVSQTLSNDDWYENLKKVFVKFCWNKYITWSFWNHQSEVSRHYQGAFHKVTTAQFWLEHPKNPTWLSREWPF